MSAADPLTELVDARVGIVRSCVRVPKDWREPALPVVHRATLSNFDHRRAPDLERMTSGKGLTEGESGRGAVVEALERYCAVQRRPGAITQGRASTLAAPAITPEEFVLYSERQYGSRGFRYPRPQADAELTWVRAADLGSGTPVYAPASLVYMGFGGAGGREFFTHTNSNGLAGGPDVAAAVLGGIYELVERDAFVLTWLARLPVPRIEFARSEGLAAGIRRHYARFEIEVFAFDLTTDLGIPAVMALAVDRSGALPSAVVGLGCSLDPAVALDKAMMEIVQVRTGIVPRCRRHGAPPLVGRYEDVHTIEDHALLAASPGRLHEFAFLLEGGPARELADLADRGQGSVAANLDLCRELLEAAGCRVAYVDLTMPDLAPFPVRIVRAIATGLQPIAFGYGEERLGGRRLFTVPRLLGHATRDLTEDDLNPCPHPLA